MVETGDREILRNMVEALSGLTNATQEMMDKQIVFVRALSVIGPKFDAASKKPGFWKKAAQGLDPSDVATFFIAIGRLSELGTSLAKFATLAKAEQERTMKEYKEVGELLSDLNSKLKSPI